MAKRVSEIIRIREYFKVISPDRVMLLKILCADAGINVVEPRKGNETKARAKKPKVEPMTMQQAAEQR